MKKLLIVVWCVAYTLLFLASGCNEPDFNAPTNSAHLSTKSQSGRKFYYSFDEKMYIEEVPNKLVLGFDEIYLLEIERYLFRNEQILYTELDDFNKLITMTIAESTNTSILMDDLKRQPGIKSVNPVYMLADFISPEISFTDEIVMKFKENVSQEEIEEIHQQFPIEIKEVTDYWQILSVSIEANILEVANAYQESGLVVFSKPDFISKIDLNQSLPSDPFFQYQYYLRNTQQPILNGNNYYVTGKYGADINVSSAWNITKGNSNIVIAVIDQGITSNHPDLPNTRQVRLSGSNFANGSSNDPSPTGDMAHGDACAGIIAASHNSEGIAGIAPNCKIMPIRIFDSSGYGVGTVLSANAILFAANNGADIISNSWMFTTSTPNYSPEIVSAIQHATTNGRGGKGCVVVFAAGNTANHPLNSGYIGFPSNVTIPGVLTVGASDRDDLQASYSPTSVLNSPYNQIIDVVAPSRKAYSWQTWITPLETHDVWTLDIPGDAGYNKVKTTDDAQNYIGTRPAVNTYLPDSGVNFDAYTGHFGGTSAACPQVAGVAALMLSVAPNLPQERVASIIRSTARKANSGSGPGQYFYQTTPVRPNGTWNERLGYGVVDATAAINTLTSVSRTVNLGFHYNLGPSGVAVDCAGDQYPYSGNALMPKQGHTYSAINYTGYQYVQTVSVGNNYRIDLNEEPRGDYVITGEGTSVLQVTYYLYECGSTVNSLDLKFVVSLK